MSEQKQKNDTEGIDGDWAKLSKSGKGLVVRQGGTMQFFERERLLQVLNEDSDKEWIRGTVYSVSNGKNEDDEQED